MANFIPGHIARKLKNPGERSKLSDSDLKQYAPELYTKRVRNRENATLYNPLATLSGENLRSAVKSMTDAELNPSLNALDRRLALLNANTAEQSRRLGAYSGQVAGGISAAQAQQKSAADTLAAQLASNQGAAQTAISNAQGSYDARAAQDAAIRGTGLDAGTSQQLAQTFVSQKTAAAQQAQTYAGLANAESQGFAGILNTAAAVLPARAADAQSQLAMQAANHANEIQQQKTDIENTRGGIFAKNLTTLRQQQFENEAARQTLNLKGAQADATAKIDAAKADKPYSSGPFAGYRPSEVSKLSQADIDRKTAAYNRQIHPKKAGDNSEIYTSGPFAGLSKAQVQAMSQDARDSKVNDYNNMVHPGASRKGGKAPDWRTPNEVGNAWKPAAAALQQIKSGQFTSADGKTKIDIKDWDRHHIAGFLASHGVEDALISAILDSIPKYNKGSRPHLSAYTVQKLIDAGYKPSVIARKLGIPTAGNFHEPKVSGKSIPGLGRLLTG